ncbi:hypothetical protein EOC93_30690 [Mesorhizobium sp. M6A.T.Ce.TU.002.03.1.1]|nr:hypothetical protein EOC93_30690 [Mesorhizobium sp. M6A.T.Ce.TU.002.03.1.1]
MRGARAWRLPRSSAGSVRSSTMCRRRGWMRPREHSRRRPLGWFDVETPTGLSFGFMARAEDWTETSGLPLRTLTGIDLLEVARTGVPA